MLLSFSENRVSLSQSYSSSSGPEHYSSFSLTEIFGMETNGVGWKPSFYQVSCQRNDWSGSQDSGVDCSSLSPVTEDSLRLFKPLSLTSTFISSEKIKMQGVVCRWVRLYHLGWGFLCVCLFYSSPALWLLGTASSSQEKWAFGFGGEGVMTKCSWLLFFQVSPQCFPSQPLLRHLKSMPLSLHQSLH